MEKPGSRNRPAAVPVLPGICHVASACPGHVTESRQPGVETLPDYLRSGLAVVSIGLNPSLPSVRAGYYFANPRNRFWRALHGSQLVTEEAVMEPGIAAMEVLLQHGMGFTDVVKRPTAGGHGLRAADFREWAPLLRRNLRITNDRLCVLLGIPPRDLL